jgi:LuxR family maltose regulon positive regulatory protein
MDIQSPLPILLPKVQIPPPRLQLVSRQRLLKVISTGLHRKLTLISAPAGYGKSTLLSEWAASCAYPLGWVTLEAGDNDIERFITYLLSGVQAAGVSSNSVEVALGARFSLLPLSLDVMMAILVNQLPMTVERLVIVLDDYHHIDNQDIHNFISALLDHLPPNIHLIISTRTEPALQLARLRAKDQLNEITANDLRFTLEEARAFFEQVKGLRLTSEQIFELEARTEGWVTGLQLASLSLKDHEHPAELIETLAGTHRYILDYLMQEVFSDLPPWLQTFMLRISILERLSPELCDTVVGELDGHGDSGMLNRSKEILEFIDTSNLFIVPLDSQRQWYRFHPLFADFLRDRVRTQSAGELSDLHRRAADWYEQHDLLSEAVEHCLAGGDVERAADLVQIQTRDLLARGEITTLNRWMGLLPDEVVQAHTRLALARAWALLMRAPLTFYDTIDTLIQQIATSFGIQPQDVLSALAESEPGSERRAALGEFTMLQAFAQRDTRQVERTIKLFKAALQYLPESELLLRGFSLAGLASTYVRAGAIKPAEEAFSQAAQIALSAGSIFGYVSSTDWQATMQAEQGQLTLATATYRKAIEVLSSQGKRPLPLSGHVYVGFARVLLEWNDLEGALEYVQIGLQVGGLVGDIDALLKGYVIQARTLQALGKEQEAQQAIQEAERYALKTQNTGCVHEAQAWKAYLALVAGNVQEAQRWAARRGFGSSKVQLEGTVDEIEQLTYARLLMVEGMASEALAIFETLINAQEQIGRMHALIESLSLQALCLRAMRRMDKALQVLARALMLAEPEGFARVFIEEGPPMAALLRLAGTQGHSPEYVRRLLEAFGEPHIHHETILEPLSERELEVLSQMAEGLTNAEIASKMIIAQSTVKTHINRIYSKLGVSTRTQAIARARQLQILP